MNLVMSSTVSVIIAVTAFSVSFCVSNVSDTSDNKPYSTTLHEQMDNAINKSVSTRSQRGFVYVPDRAVPPPTWGNKMINRFKKRTSNILGSVGMGHGGNNFHDLSDNAYEVADTASVMDDNEASGTFWNLYGGGGGHGGGGHGGGYGSGYGKGGVNKSAVGLLGFLSLLSLIQMSLATTTAAPTVRRKKIRKQRDINGTDEESINVSSESNTDRIMKIILPLMTAVTSSTRRVGVSDVKECILFQMCEANGKLSKQFGEHGISLGHMISDALGKMLKEAGKGELTSKFRYAGMAGRNGKACKKLYKSCQEVS